MKALINANLALISKIGIIVVVFSALFLFTSLTTDFFESAKFIILLAFTGLSLILLTLKFALNNKVVFVRTPLDIPLILLLVVAIVSTIMSSSPYVSLLGLTPRVHGSLLSIIVLVLFYMCLVNSLKKGRQTSFILFISLGGAIILSVISLMLYGGLKVLPFTIAQAANFTPTGSYFSTSAILAIFLPLASIEIFTSKSLIYRVVYALIVSLLAITITLTGTIATWVGALVGFLITFFITHRSRGITEINPTTLITTAIPVILTALVIALSFIPPLGGSKNPIYDHAKNFPREIQIPFTASWKTSISAFRDSPFWGSGPSSYLFNFTNYKPIEFNSSKFWNLRFDSAYNEYLGVLGTLGGIGLIALLSLTAMFFSSFTRALRSHDSRVRSLAVSGAVFFIILALHPSTLVVWAIGLFILAAFFVMNMPDEEAQRPISGLGSYLTRIAASSDSSTETIKLEALPSILLVISIALVLFASFFIGKFTLADLHHRKAIEAVSKNDGVAAYNELVKAEQLNPYNDLYRTDLAQTNFALANAIASAKAPSPSAPEGSLTDQDKQNIQTLLQQSINEARNAVTLSPRSASNWEILGLLYRQIAGVAENALVFSLDSYGRAIMQDPLNPQLRLSVGGTYYAIKNYDLAIRFFTDAINLKPDFANGYYNLSVALRDKGDLNTALSAAERVLQLVDEGSEDYRIATDYINDLKNKVSPPTPSQPPAAQTQGAITGENLPKIDLPKPENIATPTAVKKPNATPEPTEKIP